MSCIVLGWSNAQSDDHMLEWLSVDGLTEIQFDADILFLCEFCFFLLF